ncbi:aromatic amino acid beta-eliminating lyase/threonine aldolase [Naematelia encephala]|uniref:Aromatic amino acid beta-eliminating lyase/threonine aldolase n=1 Tax=Naematelia encephala TaxID=71784 RepID=A0A1Y2AXZ0_9TREE|nr:aromatic amino acid beta-eliminating lyase/threonine aldolase [Naematelia encephala]
MPTDAQLLYAIGASRGDDGYSEDETTNAFEARIAKLAGKEAALFGMSGTMTNQLAVRSHVKQPPHSVITDHRAHIHKNEAGGIAIFSQATTHALVPANGLHLTMADIESNLQLGTDRCVAPTRLICLENTLSGMIAPQSDIVAIGRLAKRHGLAMHLDGARIWNVAAAVLPWTYSGLTRRLSELLEPFDSASMCLSKGLGAPVGSVLVGTKEYINRARWFRTPFGGGIRQAGCILTASADYALTHHFRLLAGTHLLAKRLSEGLEELGCQILAPVETNMVFFDASPIGLTMKNIAVCLAALPDPIRILEVGRCVIHHQISPQAARIV